MVHLNYFPTGNSESCRTNTVTEKDVQNAADETDNNDKVETAERFVGDYAWFLIIFHWLKYNRRFIFGRGCRFKTAVMTVWDRKSVASGERQIKREIGASTLQSIRIRVLIVSSV